MPPEKKHRARGAVGAHEPEGLSSTFSGDNFSRNLRAAPVLTRAERACLDTLVGGPLWRTRNGWTRRGLVHRLSLGIVSKLTRAGLIQASSTRSLVRLAARGRELVNRGQPGAAP
jgi:hypothetical protein